MPYKLQLYSIKVNTITTIALKVYILVKYTKYISTK